MALLGSIADDLTGATDLCNTLVRGGMRTIQVVGVPSGDFVIPPADAVVVSLKSRTIATDEAVRLQAGRHTAVLLANHGPVVSGTSLDAAASAAEELEETARLHLMLRGCHIRFLTPEQVAELRQRFPLN